MTDVVLPEVVDYAEAHTTPVSPHLQQVEDSTRKDFPNWGMMVGRQEGRFLESVIFATAAVNVLEIGTFTGYSSLAMAAGLPEDGSIITCELDPNHAATARANIASSPFAGRIDVREGPALQTIATLSGPFDLIFIDADKPGYDAYFEAVLPKLAPRGLILCDNTLFHGAVLDSTAEADRGDNGTALRAFNDKLVADPRVVCAFTTIRDGITIIRHAYDVDHQTEVDTDVDFDFDADDPAFSEDATPATPAAPATPADPAPPADPIPPVAAPAPAPPEPAPTPPEPAPTPPAT